MEDDLNAQCARALGWVYYPDEVDDKDTPVPPYWWKPREEAYTEALPDFKGDFNVTRMLEQDADRRGKFEEYARELFKLVNDGIPWGYDVSFDEVLRLMRATPEQKARAFLEAVR